MITVNFTHTRPQYVRAMRLHYRERLNVPVDIGVTVISAAGGFYLYSVEGLTWLVVVFWGMAVALALLLVVALHVMPRLTYHCYARLGGPYTLTFSDEGIHFQTNNIDSHINWDLYNRVVFDRYTFLLYRGRFECTVVPADAFRDEPECRVFEKLLRARIPRVEQK